jgi:hypothetical protein
MGDDAESGMEGKVRNGDISQGDLGFVNCAQDAPWYLFGLGFPEGRIFLRPPPGEEP